MPQQIDPALKNLLLAESFRPAVTLWNRLEGRPRTADFDRSLRAEIRDPLWMLTRQWQLGEFKGEDAGSAAKARVQVSTGRVDRYAVKSENREATGGEEWQPAVPFDTEIPLEAQVERERLFEQGGGEGAALTRTYLAFRGQMGRHWVRLLRAAGLEALKPAFAGRFGFAEVGEADPAALEDLETAHVRSDPAAWQVLAMLAGRLPDGERLLAAIEDGGFVQWIEERFDAGVRAVLTDLAADFRAWFYRLVSQPDLMVNPAVEDAWAPSYLEYQLAVSAPADASEALRTTLVAEQYHQGQLDWYAFEVDRDGHLEELPGAPPPAGGFEVRETLAVIPAQIQFNGMPNVRWWELEDRRTDFGSIRAGTTDIPLLLLAEFGLVYGNDWSVIPYNLPVGTLAEINGLIVTDVFGVRTLIRAAGQGQRMDWQKWSMYGLTARLGRGPVDPRLFLAPAVAKIQEGDPLEKVILARDEMTNMVWGIEERIPGVLGTGVDGFEAATALSRYFLQRAPVSGALPEASEATIRYVLGTSVPENWIPFIATHQPGSQRQIRLQRAAMPRLTDALPDSRVEPRGAILRTGLDGGPVRQPYFLHEEEVPRAGVIVTRGFQRARWFDGKVCTWIGRRKETGRGQGASGLVFDRVAPLKT
jgi:hypothetical protein